MGFLHQFEYILARLPEIQRPRYALSFKEKMKWTGLILLAYFLLKETALYGMDPQAVDIFENMRAIIAGGFGSVISLGIGPIVTASIILQILVGGKLIDLNLGEPRDKRIFRGTQKLLAVGFTIFEAAVMVLMGALPALNNDLSTQMLIIAQLTLGGILIIYMDEVVSKWGFGSGIGLFIVAGVCSTIAIGAFNPLPALNSELVPAGRIPAFIYFIMNNQIRFDLLWPILGTLIIFAAAIHAMTVRVEIPLTYGRFHGSKGQYPLKFIYAGAIPIIFASILMANVQLWASMLAKAGYPLLGEFAGNQPINGIAYYMQRPHPIYSPDFNALVAFIYVVTLIILAVLFSKSWVETAGMDSKTVAKGVQQGGMKIPGLRGDIRIIEKVLDRYIPAVTVLGGAFAGLLVAFGDLAGALGSGAGVFLSVEIVYKMYEQMAKEQLFEINPMFRKT